MPISSVITCRITTSKDCKIPLITYAHNKLRVQLNNDGNGKRYMYIEKASSNKKKLTK